MLKKFFAALVLCAVFTLGTNVGFAYDTFQTVYKAVNFTEDMKNNEAEFENISTPYGDMKVQMRKLATSDRDKKFHATIYLKKKQIFEYYYPQVNWGYTFKIIKNTADSRQFFVIQSVDRAWLIGYSPVEAKIEIYVDSINYKHSPGTRPYIGTTNDGDLILSFEGYGYPTSQRYRFTWDNYRAWFAYSDLGGADYAVSQYMQ